MRPARLLPCLASGRGLLARPLGLALGLFHPLAGALELLFGDPHAMPGDFGKQPSSLERRDRLACRRGCFGACIWRGPICSGTVCTVFCAGARLTGGSLLAGCLPHARSRVVGEGRPVSHNGRALATAILSTECVNNPVHTGAWRRQSRCGSKGLRQRGQGLISAEALAAAERRRRALSACGRATSWQSLDCGRRSCCDRAPHRPLSAPAPGACARRPARDRGRRGRSSL